MMDVTRLANYHTCRSVSFNVQIRFSVICCGIEARGQSLIMNASMSRLAELLLSSRSRAGRVSIEIPSSKLETRHPRATVVISRYLAARPST
jgi:hypothetical protein